MKLTPLRLAIALGLCATVYVVAQQPFVGIGTAGSPAGGVLSVQGVTSGQALPVSGTFFQATQPISAASGQFASGSIASGAVASGAIASGALAAGACAVGCYPPAPGTLKQGQTAAMTGTTSTSVIAGVASNNLYITACSITSTSATATLENLQDGSGGTTLLTLTAPANGGQTMTFPTPLKVPTQGNGLFVANVTTGSSTTVGCVGWASTTSY